MKLTFISDTHSLHHQLPDLGSGDVLIHCGDFTERGDLHDTLSFARYFSQQNYTHKIVIAGNHDECFEGYRQQDAETCLLDHNIWWVKTKPAKNKTPTLAEPGIDKNPANESACYLLAIMRKSAQS